MQAPNEKPFALSDAPNEGPLAPSEKPVGPSIAPVDGCECVWTQRVGACDNNDFSRCWSACCLGHEETAHLWAAGRAALEVAGDFHAVSATKSSKPNM